MAEKAAVKVLVTGAAGQIGYAITPLIAKGAAFGCDQPIHLVLLDVPQAMQSLSGTKMELEDCAFSTLREVEITSDAEQAYKDIDFAFLIAGAVGLKPDMSRSELLKPNKPIYEQQAKYLDTQAKKTVKVLVVANPANSIARILIENVKTIKPTQITCLTRLDHNRTVSQVAYKKEIPHNLLRKIVVWGNHSNTMYPDISFAEFKDASGAYKLVKPEIHDKAFHETLPSVVQQRANEVTKARQKSSALSAANAAVDHFRSWTLGTPQGDWVSMGIYSDGSYYGLPKGIIYGLPAICKDGEYHVVADLKVSDETRVKMMKSADELVSEWEGAKC